MASNTIATDILAEQSGEGPGNGGIPRSAVPRLSFRAEKSGEGPGESGGIPRSVLGGKGTKRKKELKTIDDKYAAILECEKGVKTKSEIARQFNIPPSTLSTWMKHKDSIKEGFQKFGPKRKAMKVGDHDELEEVLVQWFRNTRSNNVPVSGPMLQAKAEELAENMSVVEFKASDGWLDRFKHRHGIAFKKVCGEANSVTTADDDNDVDADQSDEDPDDDIPLARLRSLGLNQQSARDFLTMDDDLPTSMEITDEDIIEDVISRRHPVEDDNEDDPEDIQETPATYSADQLLDACTVLRNHFRSKENASDFLKSLCHMSDDIVKDDLKKCNVQTVITSFFK